MSDVETTTAKKAPTRREVIKQLHAAASAPVSAVQDPIELEYKRREHEIEAARAQFAQKLIELGVERAAAIEKVAGSLASLGRAAQQATVAIRSIPRNDLELPAQPLLDPAQQSMIDALDSGIRAVDTAKASVTPIKRASRKGPKFPTEQNTSNEAIVEEALAAGRAAVADDGDSLPAEELNATIDTENTAEPERTEDPIEIGKATIQNPPTPAERAAANKERIKQQKLAAIKAEAAAQDAADAAAQAEPADEPEQRLSDDEAQIDEGF